jgi:Transcriptional regulators
MIVSHLTVRWLTINQDQGIVFHRLLAKVFRIHGKLVFAGLADHGISMGQPRLLRYVMEHDGCIQREIAGDNDLEPATVTKSLAIMERDGFVRREGDPGNRRVLRVYATPKGKRALKRADEAFAAIEVDCFKGFSATEKARTLRSLERIYDNLKTLETKAR